MESIFISNPWNLIRSSSFDQQQYVLVAYPSEEPEVEHAGPERLIPFRPGVQDRRAPGFPGGYRGCERGRLWRCSSAPFTSR